MTTIIFNHFSLDFLSIFELDPYHVNFHIFKGTKRATSIDRLEWN